MRNRKIFYRILILLIFVIVAGVVIVWISFFSPVKVAEEGTEVYIGTDAVYEDVKDSLRVKGILVNEAAFDLLARRKRYVSNIKPGRYIITEKMSSNDIINL